MCFGKAGAEACLPNNAALRITRDSGNRNSRPKCPPPMPHYAWKEQFQAASPGHVKQREQLVIHSPSRYSSTWCATRSVDR